METMRLRMKTAVMKAIESHALSEFPLECCGLLFGKLDKDAMEVMSSVEADNLLGSRTAFEVSPEFMYAQYKRAEKKGLDLVGIYHSHPNVPAYVSSRDLEFMRFWADAAWLILSVGEGRVIERRAYMHRRGEIVELGIKSD